MTTRGDDVKGHVSVSKTRLSYTFLLGGVVGSVVTRSLVGKGRRFYDMLLLALSGKLLT